MSPQVNGLALVGSIAKLLKAGNAAEATVTSVARALREGLGAGEVNIWFREAHATTFCCVRAAEGDPVPRRKQPKVPERAPDAERIHLVHEAEWLGVLDVTHPFPMPETQEILQIAGDLLAPFLGSLELSE